MNHSTEVVPWALGEHEQQQNSELNYTSSWTLERGSLFLLAKQEGSEVSIHLAKDNLANPHFRLSLQTKLRVPLLNKYSMQDQCEGKIQFSALGKSVCSPVREGSKGSSQAVKRLLQTGLRLRGQREWSTNSSCISTSVECF